MREQVYHRDAELEGVAGTNPRKVKTGKKPSWQQKLMGSLVKGEDGKYRPAPEKEKDIEAFTETYGRIKKLWRIRWPDYLLKALFGRFQLLDRMLEACHPSLREGFRLEVAILRKQAKADLADRPDDIFLDPKREPDGTHRALVMENKTTAGKLSKGQRATDEKLGGMHVTRSTEAVKAALDNFCARKPINPETSA